MIILASIIAACVVGILGIFWDDILKALKKLIAKVKEILGRISYGCKVFVQKMREGIKEVFKEYSKVDNHWEETTTTRIVSENEVPKDILAKASYSEELDISERVELELANAG